MAFQMSVEFETDRMYKLDEVESQLYSGSKHYKLL